MRADQRKFHYIYKITRTDGKYYIGMHSTNNLDDGYFGSGILLWKSIKKHGKEKHTKEILEFLPSRAELRTREKVLVNEEILGDPLCMNLKLGGEGGWDHVKNQSFAGKMGAKAINSRHWTPEKRSKNLQKQYANGRKTKGCFSNTAEMTIRATSASAKEKRKLTYEKRGHQKGNKNSQFGSCWISKDGHTIKIKKQELEKYISLGYHQGRK